MEHGMSKTNQKRTARQKLKHHLRQAEQCIERNDFVMARRVLTQRKLQAVTTFSQEQQGVLHWILAELAREQGELAQAVDDFAQSVSLLTANPAKCVRSMTALGKLQSKRGEQEVALATLNEAYRLAVGEQVPAVIEIPLLINLGMVHGKLGEPYSLIAFLQQAQQLNKTSHLQFQSGQIDMALGVCYMQLDQYKEARRHFKQAIYAFKLNDDQENQAGTYLNLGILSRHFQQYEEAYGYLQQAIQLYHQLGLAELKQKTMLKLAKTYYRDGELATAQNYGQAILLEANEANTLAAQTHAFLAELALAKHEYKQALTLLKQAFAVLKKRQETPPTVLWQLKAQIYQRLGRYEEAAALFVQQISRGE
jgi:HTH-type transcriptional regulator, quorum sensing regulator NprR